MEETKEPRRNRAARITLCVLVPIIALICGGCGHNAPPDDDSSVFFDKTRLAHISVANGGRAVGDFGYQGDLVQFVELSDGNWAVPLTKTEAFLHEGASKDIRFDSPTTPFLASFPVPIAPTIVRRIIFLKSEVEKSGWRYFEIESSAIDAQSDADLIELPPISDLLELPPASDLPEEKMLLEKLERARLKFEAIPGNRKW